MIDFKEYRGKDRNGEWHYGSLVMAGLNKDEPFIVCYANWGDDDCSETVKHKVIPETVGQYSGIDLDGVRLFKGDVISTHGKRRKEYGSDRPSKHDSRHMEFRGVVKEFGGSWILDFNGVPYNDAKLALKEKEKIERVIGSVGWGAWYPHDSGLYYLRQAILQYVKGKYAPRTHLMGNVTDNPELLEVGS